MVALQLWAFNASSAVDPKWVVWGYLTGPVNRWSGLRSETRRHTVLISVACGPGKCGGVFL